MFDVQSLRIDLPEFEGADRLFLRRSMIIMLAIEIRRSLGRLQISNRTEIVADQSYNHFK